ncbi:MAG: UbiA prenyltransferase family protein, partial [Patescibacteria group bacterium]
YVPLLTDTILGFIAFCFLSSSNYIFNDVLDAPADRRHPFKKFRPVASGKLSVKTALLVSVLLLIFGLGLAQLIGQTFFLFSLVFILLQYSYSIVLKHVSVIDIIAITAGYVLRVYAGEAASGYHISIWLALAALSLALFLAIGKRRAELTLIQGTGDASPRDTRAALSHYSEKLLDAYTSMFATSTFISYTYFTFLERPITVGLIFRNYSDFVIGIPDRKWMMMTIPFVLYGIMRYMQLIYHGKGESPEQVLTTDLPLLSTVILWVGATLFVIYGIGG